MLEATAVSRLAVMWPWLLGCHCTDMNLHDTTAEYCHPLVQLQYMKRTWVLQQLMIGVNALGQLNLSICQPDGKTISGIIWQWSQNKSRLQT